VSADSAARIDEGGVAARIQLAHEMANADGRQWGKSKLSGKVDSESDSEVDSPVDSETIITLESPQV
jgi:hypothetical protein